jgi:uncharacterized protein YwgA
MVDEAQPRSGELLYEFTANLVKVFEIRGTILGKLDLQKTVYFMKRLGVKTPFEFRWNLLGPYSYELAHHCTILEIEGLLSYSGAYELKEEEAKRYRPGCTLSSDMVRRLKSFFDKMREICEEKAYNRVNFIECAASLDFINQNITAKNLRRIMFFLFWRN